MGTARRCFPTWCTAGMRGTSWTKPSVSFFPCGEWCTIPPVLRLKYSMGCVFHVSPSQARLYIRMPGSDLWPSYCINPPRQDTLAQGGQAQRFHLQPILVGPNMGHLRAHCLGGDQCLLADTHNLHAGLRWYWRSCYWFGWQGQSVCVPACLPLAR